MTDRKWQRKAKRFARRHGYFWLPCTTCGEMFGGQEWGGASVITDIGGNWSSGSGICATCAGTRLAAAEERLRNLEQVVEVTASTSSGWVTHTIGQAPVNDEGPA